MVFFPQSFGCFIIILFSEEIHENFINIVINYNTFKFGKLPVRGFYFPET